MFEKCHQYYYSRVESHYEELVPLLRLVPVHLHAQYADVLDYFLHLVFRQAIGRVLLLQLGPGCLLLLPLRHLVLFHAQNRPLDQIKKVVLILAAGPTIKVEVAQLLETFLSCFLVDSRWFHCTLLLRAGGRVTVLPVHRREEAAANALVIVVETLENE